MLAEAMNEMVVPVVSSKNKKAEKKRRAERAEQLKEEAALRAEEVAREEAEDERIRKQWALDEMDEKQEDTLRREEAAAFWYCNRYDDRPTSSWCDVRLSVALGQESGGGRVKNVDLDSVSIDSLEATVFSSIPLDSRILRLAIVRSEIGETTKEVDEKGTAKQPRLCCMCRLSDIQSVLCLRRKYRSGALTTQTVHGHIVKVSLWKIFSAECGIFLCFSDPDSGSKIPPHFYHYFSSFRYPLPSPSWISRVTLSLCPLIPTTFQSRLRPILIRFTPSRLAT